MVPNVLLVVFDTARRDVLEPYGAPAGATPAVADLAHRGTAFDRAYSTASWTFPSHASMLSGLMPRALGLARGGGGPQGLRPALEAARERLLPEVLRRAGYRTVGLSTNMWVSEHSGFDLGFDEFTFKHAFRQLRMASPKTAGPRAKLAWIREGLRARSDDGTAEVGTLLRRSIAGWSGVPTFWFVNLIECHSPYLPPRPWNDLSMWQRARAAIEAQRYLNFESIILYAAGKIQIPAAAFERMRQLYARAASYMDVWLGSVLEALDERGILDDTLVIVTSDHGENFGEGGLIAHGFSLDERLIHIPLVVAGPGDPAGNGPVSLAELPRIVAQAAGVDDHPYRREELPEGVAVAQHDPMAPPDDPRIRQAAERWDLSDEGIERLTAHITCAADGRHKLVVRNGQEMYYDLQADSAESSPLDPASAGGSLPKLRAALEHPAVSTVAPMPRPGAQQAQPSAEELSQLEEQMKLLGYL
jgi:arylsulfatase A-like enzyme